MVPDPVSLGLLGGQLRPIQRACRLEGLVGHAFLHHGLKGWVQAHSTSPVYDGLGCFLVEVTLART